MKGRRARATGRTGSPGTALFVWAAFLATVGVAFSGPWIGYREDEYGPDLPTLERYAPHRDGAAALFAAKQPGPGGLVWRSENTQVSPGISYRSPRAGGATASGALLRIDDRNPGGLQKILRQASVAALEARTLSPSGHLSVARSESLRVPGGEFLVASDEGGHELIFDPPARILPPDLEGGRTWKAAGEAGGSAYEVDGRVKASAPRDSLLGRFTDCLLIEVRLVLRRQNLVERDTTTVDRRCAGVGVVERTTFGPLEVKERWAAVARDGHSPPGFERPPGIPAHPEPALGGGDPSTWTFGAFADTSDLERPTVSPRWIPTIPPLVLSATFGGDLVALEAAGPEPGTIRWRFRARGAIYSPPAFDPASGRIYFGTSAKLVYALDARGMFLWSSTVDDNVAARPLLVGEILVVASEDHRLYGFDADTGRQRWRSRTGASLVSSPALIGRTVVVGSDSGRLLGVDPMRGERRWVSAARGPVEAPVVGSGSVAFVAARKGVLALDVNTGKKLWQTRELDHLRTAPAIASDDVLVVDGHGSLHAVNRRTGERRWTARGGFIGPPVVAGETIVVATSHGLVESFGPDGRRRGSWRASTFPRHSRITGSTATEASRPSFALGPTTGGGSLWLVDDHGVVHRLGPGPVGVP